MAGLLFNFSSLYFRLTSNGQQFQFNSYQQLEHLHNSIALPSDKLPKGFEQRF